MMKPSSSLPSDTIPNPKEECKVVQLRSGRVLTDGSQGATRKLMENDTKPTKNDETINQDKTSKNAPEKLTEEDNKPQNLKKGKKILEEPTPKQHQVEKSSTPPLPYPQRFHKETKDQHFHKFLETFKKLEINIPLAEALEQMPLYPKFLKELINKKRD